jgi:hypothetical protein
MVDILILLTLIKMAVKVAILTMHTLLKMAPPFQALQSVNFAKNTNTNSIYVKKHLYIYAEI